MSDIGRREFLRLASAGTAVVFAGCGGAFGGDGADANSGGDEDSKGSAEWPSVGLQSDSSSLGQPG